MSAAAAELEAGGAVGAPADCLVPPDSAGERTPERQACSSKPDSDKSPDTAVKQLLASIESLQQQQLLAEEARLDADEAERCANLEILALEEQLHAVLHQAASLDDQLQDAQLALELRLQDRAVKEELLRKQTVLLDGLRAELGRLNRLCEEKGLLAEELQAQLLAKGASESSLAELRAEALRATIPPSPSSGSPPESRRASWLSSSSGFFGSFKWGSRRQTAA